MQELDRDLRAPHRRYRPDHRSHRPKADASALQGKLRHAKRELRNARLRLTAAEAAVAATLSASSTGTAAAPAAATADPATTAAPSAPSSPTLAKLQAKVRKERRAVRRWKHRVRRLAARVHLQRRLAAWESHGTWKPIIRMAAAKYHVKADGMYRMMMRESGGRRFAGSNTAFKGLFQYYTGTWAASWNPTATTASTMAVRRSTPPPAPSIGAWARRCGRPPGRLSTDPGPGVSQSLHAGGKTAGGALELRRPFPLWRDSR